MSGKIYIKTKAEAEQFLLSCQEFTHHDFYEGEFWFRFDGPSDDVFGHKEFTINHEKDGIIGATKDEAVDYVYRNRKRLNKVELSDVIIKEKSFEIVCAPYGMKFLGIKWAEDSERGFNSIALSSGSYSERFVYNLFDDFSEGFNHICKDKYGEFYAVYIDSEKKPLVWRKVEPVVKLVPQVSFEAYLAGRENEWGEFECSHGYGVFNGDYPTTNNNYGYINGDHIEIIGEMDGYEGFWELDVDAAKHYEECEGKKIIRDIPEIDAVFIDTPENRKKIMTQLELVKPSFSDMLADAVDRANTGVFDNSKLNEKEHEII